MRKRLGKTVLLLIDGNQGHKADAPTMSQNEYPFDSWWLACPQLGHSQLKDSNLV